MYICESDFRVESVVLGITTYHPPSRLEIIKYNLSTPNPSSSTHFFCF